MTRTRFARLAAATVVAVALLPLSGCVYAQIPTDVPAAEPSASSEPSETPSDEPSTSSETLTFAEGLDLTSSSFVQWGDGLMVDDEWKVASPDDGNGNWSYSTLDDSCTVHFWQGTLGSGIAVPGDDSATTDALIAAILGGAPADVTPNAKNGELSYQLGGSGGVDARQVIGEETGRTWIMTARGFSQVGAGLYMIADCTGTQADVEAIIDQVNAKSAVIVVP